MSAKPIKIKPNLIDQIVGVFSPKAALERFRSRTQMAIAGQWWGARFDRRATANWAPYGGSADSDLVFDLRWLRNRSRDCMRNNPLALGAVNTNVTSVIGSGLKMRSTIDADTLGLSQEQAQAWQEKWEREFRLWAGSPDACDATRTNTFNQLQALAFRSALESGDVFASLPWIRRKTSAYETKVQLIEADRVVNKGYGINTERLAQGVETDDDGAPLNYHILRHHPGGLIPLDLKWDIVPVFGAKTGRRNIIHLFDKRRPGQSRGIPYIAPIIEMLKQLGDYTNAEITAAVISGMFSVFITTETGQGMDLGPDGTPPQANSPGSTLQMGAGAILDLAPGEKVDFANPGRPSTAFDPFVQAVLRQIGVALELPFEILIKHFTASYSAARAAMLEAWRFFLNRREWVAAQFCQPIAEALLEEAIAKGRIDAPGFFDDPIIRAAYCRMTWIGDSPGQIDPLKEVNAAKGRLELNLTSISDECVQLTGEDWDNVVKRRASEEKTLQELGLVTVYAPLNPANVNAPLMEGQGSNAADNQDAPDTDLEKS